MLKTALKACLKVIVAVVLVRLAVLALGVNLATGIAPGKSGSSLTEFRDMGREALESVAELLRR